MKNKLINVLVPIIILAVSVSIFGQKAPLKNEETVQKIITALQTKDLKTLTGYMADNVILVQPLTVTGATEDEAMTRREGKKDVTEFLQWLFGTFKEIKFTDVNVSPTKDGKSVFVQMKSHFIIAANGESYRNVYVVKYDFENEKVVKVAEYLNPIAISKAFNPKPVEQ